MFYKNYVVLAICSLEYSACRWQCTAIMIVHYSYVFFHLYCSKFFHYCFHYALQFIESLFIIACGVLQDENTIHGEVVNVAIAHLEKKSRKYSECSNVLLIKAWNTFGFQAITNNYG